MPERGPLETRVLAAQDRPREKAVIMAEAHVKETFSVGAHQVQILVAREERGLLRVDLRVTLNGQPVNVDGPFYYKNPPIKVPDGTARQETVGRDGAAVTLLVPNAVENPAEALRQIVRETLRTKGIR